LYIDTTHRLQSGGVEYVTFSAEPDLVRPRPTYEGVVVIQSSSSYSSSSISHDECRFRHADMFNRFPRRRRCDSLTRVSNIVRGLLGDPFKGEDVVVYTIDLMTPLQQLADQNPEPGFPIRSMAYVSGGKNANDAAYPAWAQVQFRFLYDTADTVQLTRLEFVDEREADADAYYAYARWNTHVCADNSSYAYWDVEGQEPTCDCVAYHIQVSGVCEPGCANGRMGPLCREELATDCPVQWNEHTKLLRYDCSQVICLDETRLESGVCSKQSDAMNWLLIGSLIGAGVIAIVLVTLLVRCYLLRRTTNRFTNLDSKASVAPDRTSGIGMSILSQFRADDEYRPMQVKRTRKHAV